MEGLWAWRHYSVTPLCLIVGYGIKLHIFLEMNVVMILKQIFTGVSHCPADNLSPENTAYLGNPFLPL